MRAAIHLYERMGFKRYPEFDFSVGDNVTVRGYRLDLGEGGNRQAVDFRAAARWCAPGPFSSRRLSS